MPEQTPEEWLRGVLGSAGYDPNPWPGEVGDWVPFLLEVLEQTQHRDNPPDFIWRNYSSLRRRFPKLEVVLQARYGFVRPQRTLLDTISSRETSILLYKSPNASLWGHLLALSGVEVACDTTGTHMEGSPKNRELQIPFLHINRELLREVPELPERIYTFQDHSVHGPDLAGYIPETLIDGWMNYHLPIDLILWTRT